MSTRHPEPRTCFPGGEFNPAYVRRARLEAGLTMAELAGSDLTRQAVSLIETGKARPSMRTLEIFASRTGSPVDSFLRAPRADLRSAAPASAAAGVGKVQALCLPQPLSCATSP